MEIANKIEAFDYLIKPLLIIVGGILLVLIGGGLVVKREN